MCRITRIALATLATVFAGHPGPAGAAPEITICHMPQESSGTVQTIRVSIHDWPDHKAHGDVPGYCRVVLDGTRPAPATIADGSPEAGAPASGDDDPGAATDGEFQAVLCDDRPGSEGRLIEVNETGRIAVRAAECG